MKRTRKKIDREFILLIREVLNTAEFRSMKHYRHHVKSNVFDHSLKVAHLCYRHCKRFGEKKDDLRESVLAALLHDFYLYDWHDRSPENGWHLFAHPYRAANNAAQHFPWLTDRQLRRIRRHMFPLTLLPPTDRAGWLLCFYDKVAALSDYMGK